MSTVYAAVDQRNNNLIADTKSVGIVATESGEVASLLSMWTGGKMMDSPKCVFLCTDATKALDAIAEWHRRTKEPAMDPRKVSWVNGRYLGGCAVDLAPPPIKLVTQ